MVKYQSPEMHGMVLRCSRLVAMTDGRLPNVRTGRRRSDGYVDHRSSLGVCSGITKPDGPSARVVVVHTTRGDRPCCVTRFTHG